MMPDLPLPESLLARMDATPQNPRYHREGSVLAHTQYVVQQFEAHRSEFELSDAEAEVLYWAAVLHDIGKTVTTIWENGRHRSPGHERAGVPMAQDILLDHPEISDANRRRILDIVRWHGLPLRYAQQMQPIEVVKSLGTRTDLRLLAIFAMCDFWGRDCDDKPEVMAYMHRFRDMDAPKAEFELGKFDDLALAGTTWNLRHKNAVWNAYKINNIRLLERLVQARQTDEIQTRGQRVTIAFGAPLSGKSTWLDAHFPTQFRVSLHEHGLDNTLVGNAYHIARKMIEFKHLMRVYLNRHHHVILESRDLNDDIRQQLAEVLRDMPVELDYVVMETTLDTMLARQQATEGDITEELIRASHAAMELIHPWEAHHIQYQRG